jgi:hypothetical protein
LSFCWVVAWDINRDNYVKKGFFGMYLGCVEDEDAYCGEDGGFCNIFDNEDVKRRKPTIVRNFVR